MSRASAQPWDKRAHSRSRKGLTVNTAKHRYSVLILCTAIALGLMAFSASAAQAVTWMVNGSNVESDLSVEMPITIENLPGTKEKHIVLLSTIEGTKFSMLCEAVEFQNAVLHAGGLATGEFWWSKCRVSLNGKESPACKPQETIKLGEKGETEKEEGKTDEEFKTVATLEFSEECPLGIKLPLSGIYWIEETSGEWEVEKLTHTVREAEGLALAVGGLKLGSSAAFIDGTITLEIKERGVAKKFSALAF